MNSLTRTANKNNSAKGELNMGALTKERNSFPTIQYPMVISERNNHYRTDNDLPVNHHGLVPDSMHTFGTVRAGKKHQSDDKAYPVQLPEED
jgi:hypothetical protein